VNSPKQKIRPILSLLLLMSLLFSSGCAWFAARPPSPPLDRHEIADIVSAFEKQEKAVQFLFWTGTLAFEVQGAQSEAEVLIAARRDPASIRIEITHGWGQPLLHIQINGSRLDVISFSEKRHYQGRLGMPWILKQVPFPLNPNLIWSLARAYPVLPPYRHAQSMKEKQLTLMDEQDAAIQMIDLYPDGHPHRVRICRQGAVLSFYDYQDQGGILYAKEIQLADRENNTVLTLDIRQMTFNRPVPEALFRQDAPPGFEVVQL
jgi:hypothetical protein